MNHTPEPWEVCFPTPAIGDAQYIGISAGSWDIALILYWGDHDSTHQANARRIVACVNACQGINPEAVPDLLAACEKLYAFVQAIVYAEFDPAIEGRPDASSAVCDAWSAIAKAKGQ